jgi:hypothetical protein
VLIAAISTGVVRRGAQHRQTLLIMKNGVLPDWWPKGWLRFIGVIQLLFFWGAVVLVIMLLVYQVTHQVPLALILMSVFSSIFIWMIGSFLGMFCLSGILIKRARKYGGVDLPKECF